MEEENHRLRRELEKAKSELARRGGEVQAVAHDPRNPSRRHLDLAPAPRAVPLSATTAALFSGIGAIGWGVLAFASIFVWVFAAQSELVTLFEFAGATATTRGVVQGTVRTSASEGRRLLDVVETTDSLALAHRFVGSQRSLYIHSTTRSRGAPIFDIEFSYRVAGQEYRSASYVTWPVPAAVEPGSDVSVECAARLEHSIA